MDDVPGHAEAVHEPDTCPRTSEWALRNVFAKLGIRSSCVLHAALPDAAPPRVPA